MKYLFLALALSIGSLVACGGEGSTPVGTSSANANASPALRAAYDDAVSQIPLDAEGRAVAAPAGWKAVGPDFHSPVADASRAYSQGLSSQAEVSTHFGQEQLPPVVTEAPLAGDRGTDVRTICGGGPNYGICCNVNWCCFMYAGVLNCT